ncbi:MAG: DUF1592 domain-containing protein [Myxococcaceae bacterium]
MARLILVAALVLLGGCYGDASLDAPGPGAGNGPGRGPGGGPNCGPECDQPAPAALARRLTHTQWESSVRDLLRLDALPGLSTQFTGDTSAGIFDSHVAGLKVGATLWADYQRAAETLAAQITASDANVQRIVPANLPADPAAKARAFIDAFGRRAYRRPLTAAELDRHLSIFQNGTALTGVTDPFRAGVRITVQAMLQSPLFLYRVEQGGEAGQGEILLTGWELASRLSFALWNTMPDDALLEAAASGALATPEGLEAEAKRMLIDPRARAMLGRFHHQLFDLDQIKAITRDPAKYPGLTGNFGEALATEVRLFVDDVVFTRTEGLNAVLTSTRTFANAEVASVYGVTPASGGNTFVPVELDPAQRSGLLTRAGFLAAYGHGDESDPIRRGVFVNLRLLCSDLPPPPNNVPPLPPSTGKTTRERVDEHTGPGTCGAGCHSTYINPVGFAFENYDGLGRHRTEENGFPVDATAEFNLQNGDRLRYADARDFSAQLAGALQTHRCYARHWVEYVFGRDEVDADDNLIERLATRSLEGTSVQQLVLDLVTSRGFRARPVESTP